VRRHACALLAIAVVGCGGSETPPPGTVSGQLTIALVPRATSFTLRGGSG
jgi:hypothetical protein